MTDSINRIYIVAYVGPKVFAYVCVRVCKCAQVHSSLIFSHANEGVGAKITRPIFPPPQWGHYLLMFCIFPPPSHSHAFFILSLLLGSSHRHPVTISAHFQQLLKHHVFPIIKDGTVKPCSILCGCKKSKR